MMTEDLGHIKISIIIPIYNIGGGLRKCIGSVLGQTHGNLEIILVDDGSTDSSASVCDQYAQDDGRVRVIHKDNGGPASARQAGLDISTGQYVGFVDGDDYVEPEMFGYLLGRLAASGADFIHSGLYKDKWETRSCACDFGDTVYDVRDGKAEFIKAHVLKNDKEYMHPSMCTKLFRAGLIKESHGEVPVDMSYGEDMLGLMSCILNADTIETCSRSFYHYVFRESSIMNGTAGNLEREFRLYNGLLDFFTVHGLANDVKKYLDCMFYNQVLEAFGSLGNKYLCASQYCIRDTSDIEGKKVALYGAGNVGMGFYQQLCRDEKCDVVAVADANFRNIHMDYVTVRSPGELLALDYDLVLVAVRYQSAAEEIAESLVELGVCREKILWKCPDKVFDAEG